MFEGVEVKKMPLVSIVMPAFNAEETIDDAINSVLAQSLADAVDAYGARTVNSSIVFPITPLGAEHCGNRKATDRSSF
jgi:hypothetical protein